MPEISGVAVSVERDVVYSRRGAGGERELRLDIYRAEGAGDTAVLLVHGGGWRRGSKEMVASQAEGLARQGFVVLCPEYRLLGEAAWPAQIQDVKSAIRWTRSQAGALGIDPAKVAAQGNSAGAHLVLLAAGTHADAAHDADEDDRTVSAALAAVAAVYPPTLFFATGERHSGALPARVLVGEEATEAEATWASPLTHVTPAFPPTMLLHGDADKVVPFSASLRMWERLREAGVPVDVQLFAGFPHGFANLESALPVMASTVGLFIRRHVAEPGVIEAEVAAREAAAAATAATSA